MNTTAIKVSNKITNQRAGGFCFIQVRGLQFVNAKVKTNTGKRVLPVFGITKRYSGRYKRLQDGESRYRLDYYQLITCKKIILPSIILVKNGSFCKKNLHIVFKDRLFYTRFTSSSMVSSSDKFSFLRSRCQVTLIA